MKDFLLDAAEKFMEKTGVKHLAAARTSYPPEDFAILSPQRGLDDHGQPLDYGRGRCPRRHVSGRGLCRRHEDGEIHIRNVARGAIFLRHPNQPLS